VASQLEKSATGTKTKFLLVKLARVPKNAELYAEFESVEKLQINLSVKNLKVKNVLN